MARRAQGISYSPTKSKALIAALDNKATKAMLTRHMFRATRLNGEVATAAMRRTIQSGKGLTKNAALTQAIKGGDKPAVDDGTLFASITTKAVDIRTVFVGVLRSDSAYNVALIVHEGAVIKVTDRMRGMFFQLWLKSGGGAQASGVASAANITLTGRARELFQKHPGPWFPLKASTSAIVIPHRRFVDVTFKDPWLKAQMKTNWKRGYQDAFREMAARIGTG